MNEMIHADLPNNEEDKCQQTTDLIPIPISSHTAPSPTGCLHGCK